MLRKVPDTMVEKPEAEPRNHEPSAAQYAKDGFFLASSILPLDLIQRVIPHMDAVIDERYETGVEPQMRWWKPGDDPQKLCKIDQSHLSDNAIHELISHPAIGQWAAKITGAKRVQVWATQLLFKPTGTKEEGNVGWHQDQQYWRTWFEGECFTAWVAVSDVTAQSGPMRFVRGTHRCGLLKSGDFFGGNLDAVREKFQSEMGQPWEEVAAVLPPGGVSFHHRYTIHGSGSNTAPLPRRSFAIHLRTEKSRPVAGATHYYTQHLDDPKVCPVIYPA